MYNKDDIVYILENDQVVRKAKVAGRQDDLYIVQLIGPRSDHRRKPAV